MGNEMGNRNINGLQASEQENIETTEVMDQAQNTSFLTLNGLDGLKGVSEYLADDSKNSEEDEANNLVIDKLPEPLAVFRDVEDMSQSALEKEDTKLLAYDESSMFNVSDTKYTDLAITESLEEDDKLLQGTVTEETEKQEECKDAAEESLEIRPMPTEKDDQADSASPREHQDSTDMLHNSTEGELCKVMIRDQTVLDEGSERDSADQDSEKNTANESLENSVVPNDAEVSMPLTDHNDLHEIISDSAQTGYDESPIEQQILEQKVVQETNGKDNEMKNVLVERKSSAALVMDEQMLDEPINAAYQDIIDSEISKLEAHPDAVTVVQATNCEDYESINQLEERKSTASSVLEEQSQDVEINSAIGKLPDKNDLDEVCEQTETEPNRFQGSLDYDKETFGEELMMDDSENDSFDIQLNTIGPCKENDEDVGSDAVFELAIQTGCISGLETNVVETGNSTLQMDTSIADGECEKNEIGTEVESESSDGELSDQVKVVADSTSSNAVMNQTTAASAMEDEALENKEELFAIDIIQENPSDITFSSDFKPDNEKQVRDIINLSMSEIMTNKKEEAFIPPDSAWCIPILDSEALERHASNFDINSDSSVIESVKCVTYEYEKDSPEADENTGETEESKQKPPFGHESYKSKPLEVPGMDVREYRVSTSNEDNNKVSNKSPLLCQRKTEEGRESTERMPFSNYMKQEGTVLEAVEKEEVLLLKKTVKASCQIPSKKSTTASSTSRENQKPRSSLFGSCMCCTTAIN